MCRDEYEYPQPEERADQTVGPASSRPTAPLGRTGRAHCARHWGQDSHKVYAESGEGDHKGRPYESTLHMTFNRLWVMRITWAKG
jgi:hypothetical protein